VLLAEHFRSQILLGAAGEGAGKCTSKSSAVFRSMDVGDAKVGEMGPTAFVKNDVFCKIEER